MFFACVACDDVYQIGCVAMYVLSDFVCVSGNRASDGVTRKEVLSAQVTLGPLTGVAAWG